jgi:plasmid stabilization system protein ParE
MQPALKFSDRARQDLEAIASGIRDAHLGFGNTLEELEEHATRHVQEIQKKASDRARSGQPDPMLSVSVAGKAYQLELDRNAGTTIVRSVTPVLAEGPPEPSEGNALAEG